MSANEQARAGSGSTYPMPPSKLCKNGHVVIDGRPCKIVELKASQGKISLEGIDIFTGQLRKRTLSNDDQLVNVPNVSRTEYQLVNVDDGILNLMTQDGVPKDDIKVPDGSLGSNISDDFNEGKDLLVTVQWSMGEEQAISYKEAPNKEKDQFPQDRIYSYVRRLFPSIYCIYTLITKGQYCVRGDMTLNSKS